ncbi:MAG: ISNCY family transposase [Deltaproteobacteria bacterium]
MRPATAAAQEAKAMTRREVIQKAIEGRITWAQAAGICGVTPRHMSRLRERHEKFGIEGLRDGRTGKRQPSRVPPAQIEELCRLKREVYPDFSVRHFHEFAVAKHKLRLGYTWTRDILQSRGLVEKAPARGKYRRKRERRPMRGMLLHLDASTHSWIAGLPMWDLNVMLDDADGRILFARFVEQEGTRSTLQALEHVMRRWGRFCEFYTDRGSHFCRTSKAGAAPDEDQSGQVARVLKALGIRHILARSPEARGRSERAFGTIQGRLPQELRLAAVGDYEAANAYLTRVFVPDFNRRFTVEPTEPESAFVPLAGVDLRLLLSVHHDRTVYKDNTVVFGALVLQLPPGRDRIHYARCPVVVHELLDDTLAVSYQGSLIARFRRDGQLVLTAKTKAA